MKKKCITIIERKNSHVMISSFNRHNKKKLECFARGSAFNVSKAMIELHKNITPSTPQESQKKLCKKEPFNATKKIYKPLRQHF